MILNKMLQIMKHTVNICCNCYNREISYTQSEVLYGIIQIDVLINIFAPGLYLLSILSHENDNITDHGSGTPGRGKYVVDGINAPNKS